MSTYSQVILACCCTPDSLEKRTAMKKLGVVLTLFCAISFSVWSVRETGPCYGTGCPVLKSSKAPAAAKNVQAQETAASTDTPAPAQKKHHHKFWIL